MEIETAFQIIGNFGLRQKLYFVIFGLKDFWINAPIMQLVFSCVPPKYFLCYVEDSTSKVYNNTCPHNDPNGCSKVDYFYDGGAFSIIAEWNLICSEEYKVQLVQSMYLGGVLVGALIFGFMADILGRMKTFTITMFFAWLFSVTSSFTPTYWTFVLVRFLCGVCIQGSGLASYVLLVECLGSPKRGHVLSLSSFFYVIGLIAVSCFAFFVREWRLLTFLSTVWGVIFVFSFCIVPESPRWLLANRFVEKAEKVMINIAKGNGTFHSISDKWSLNFETKDNPKSTGDNLYMLCKNWTLLKYTFIQSYTWFISSVVYYGMTLAAGSLGDIYTTTILLAIVEIPATCIQMCFINYIGRRPLLCSFLIGCGISCLVIQFLQPGPYSTYMRTGFALVGKLCSAGEFSVIYIYSAELFPTSIRNSAMGMVSVFSRVGGIIAPFIVLLGKYVTDIHFTIFGALAFVAGIINLWLPETNERPLPESVDDLLLLDVNKNQPTFVSDDSDEEIYNCTNSDTSKLLTNVSH